MNGFVASVLTVLRGSVVAQVIGFAALPLLTRLYPPSAFGIFQVITAILTLMLIASALRLEVAILSVEQERLPRLVACSWWIVVFTTLIGALIISGFLVLGGPADTALGFALCLLPPLALLSGWGVILHYLALRRKDFSINANAKILQATAATAAAAGLGFGIPSGFGLLIADVAGRLASVTRLYRWMVSQCRMSLSLPSRNDFKTVLRENKQLWGIALPGALVNALGSAFTALILLLLFSAEDAGQFALVERGIGMPIGLLAAASSQVFMAGFAESGREGGRSRVKLFRDIVRSHLRLGVLPALAMFFAAPAIIPWFFGAAWGPAGLYAQALMPLFLVSFVVGPVNMALTLAGKQMHQLAWDIGRLLVIAVVWTVISLTQMSPIEALWLYCVASCACYGAYLFIADRALVVSQGSAG